MNLNSKSDLHKAKLFLPAVDRYYFNGQVLAHINVTCPPSGFYINQGRVMLERTLCRANLFLLDEVYDMDLDLYVLKDITVGACGLSH